MTHGAAASRAFLLESLSREKTLSSSLSLLRCSRRVAFGCRRKQRDYPGDLNAYVSNGKSDSVSVIDLGQFKVLKTIAVGRNPTGVTANPKKNEIYAVNTESNNISFIDAAKNVVVATVGVHRAPYFIDVSADGTRGYVANSGSANVSILDLEKRLVLATVGVGATPGLARVSPDGKTVVVSNRGGNSVSILDAAKMQVRATVQICRASRGHCHPPRFQQGLCRLHRVGAGGGD